MLCRCSRLRAPPSLRKSRIRVPRARTLTRNSPTFRARDVTDMVLPPTNCLNAILQVRFAGSGRARRALTLVPPADFAPLRRAASPVSAIRPAISIKQVNSKANRKPYEFTNLVALGKTLLNEVRVLAGLDPNYRNITIFAPTDDAFATFMASVNGTVANEVIPDILRYHVSPSFVDIESLPGLSGIPTLLGNSTLSSVSPQILLATRQQPSPPLLLTYGLGNAGVIDTLECQNGVIHVVNSVLFPPNPMMATLRLENLTVLVDSLRKASLAHALDRETEAVTLFAPSDEAFAAWSSPKLTKEETQSVLTYHAVAGRIMSFDLKEEQQVESLQGGKLNITVSATDGEIYVDGAKVIKANVLTANGVVHIIDKVSLADESGC